MPNGVSLRGGKRLSTSVVLGGGFRTGGFLSRTTDAFLRPPTSRREITIGVESFDSLANRLGDPTQERRARNDRRDQ